MTIFTRNQPISTDDLDISQPILLANTNAADSVFGFDHYAFSNTTANQGLHNTVTTPAYSSNFAVPTITTTPPVTTTSPILYAFQPIDGSGSTTTQLGVLQYSRGPSDAVPTPVTMIQSPSAGISINNGANTPILDFFAIPGAMAILYASDYTQSLNGAFLITWGGTSFSSIKPIFSGFLAAIAVNGLGTGSKLALQNNSSNVSQMRWTLQFLRTQ